VVTQKNQYTRTSFFHSFFLKIDRSLRLRSVQVTVIKTIPSAEKAEWYGEVKSVNP